MTPRTPQTAAGKRLLASYYRTDPDLGQPNGISDEYRHGRAVLTDRIVAIEDEARALPDPTEPREASSALIEKVRELANDYERKHAQSEIDAAEFGPKAGANGRWKARMEGVEAALVYIVEWDAGLRSGALPPAPVTRLFMSPERIEAALSRLRGPVSRDEGTVMVAAQAAADALRGSRIERGRAGREAGA